MTIKQFLKERKIHISYTERSNFGYLVALNIRKQGIKVKKISEKQMRNRITIEVFDYPKKLIPTIKKIYKQYKAIKEIQSNTS
jgi:hypothetical protein